MFWALLTLYISCKYNICTQLNDSRLSVPLYNTEITNTMHGIKKKREPRGSEWYYLTHGHRFKNQDILCSVEIVFVAVNFLVEGHKLVFCSCIV